jgi:hypothetical protein
VTNDFYAPDVFAPEVQYAVQPAEQLAPRREGTITRLRPSMLVTAVGITALTTLFMAGSPVTATTLADLRLRDSITRSRQPGRSIRTPAAARDIEATTDERGIAQPRRVLVFRPEVRVVRAVPRAFDDRTLDD